MKQVWTDRDGSPQQLIDTQIEHVLAAAVSRGDLRRDEVDEKRNTLRSYAAARLNGAPSFSEDAYLTFARATGVLNAIDDPRMRPSWAR